MVRRFRVVDEVEHLARPGPIHDPPCSAHPSFLPTANMPGTSPHGVNGVQWRGDRGFISVRRRPRSWRSWSPTGLPAVSSRSTELASPIGASRIKIVTWVKISAEKAGRRGLHPELRVAASTCTEKGLNVFAETSTTVLSGHVRVLS